MQCKNLPSDVNTRYRDRKIISYIGQQTILSFESIAEAHTSDVNVVSQSQFGIAMVISKKEKSSNLNLVYSAI